MNSHSKPTLLDLFCGAGGAGWGYHLAGFDVTGVDIKLQPHYPLRFFQGDALEYVAAYGHEYDVIHASPPCQFYSRQTRNARRPGHADMVDLVRAALVKTHAAYVIENVPGSPLVNFLVLHGSMFGLLLFRERWFECHPMLAFSPATPRIDYRPTDLFHRPTKAAMSTALGIDWMTTREMRQAIPPAYTRFIGTQLLSGFPLPFEGRGEGAVG